jgi:hypothetical protein
MDFKKIKTPKINQIKDAQTLIISQYKSLFKR